MKLMALFAVLPCLAFAAPEGYSKLSAGAGVETYWRDATGPEFPRLWVLFDYAMPRSSARSKRMLLDVNCRTRQVRVVEQKEFTGPGATGEVVGTASSEWLNAAPGSTEESFVKLRCPA